MLIGTLQSRLSYFFKRPRVSSAASHPGKRRGQSVGYNERATARSALVLLIPQYAWSPWSSFQIDLCQQNAATWWNRPRLLSKACKFTASLTARAYNAVGQGASALHAMGILPIYQTKGLKVQHKGIPDGHQLCHPWV